MQAMVRVIDAHQHFWRFGSYQTSWLDKPPYAGDPAFTPIARDFGPQELCAELETSGVDACIAVEAADHDHENASLLANARAYPWIAGVVGWVPLDRPDEAERRLDSLANEPLLVGVRHLVNVEPDAQWVLRPAVLDGLAQVAARALSFDFVGILPEHLQCVPRLAAALPQLRIVIDHLAKPPLGQPVAFRRWADLLAEAARAPNVFAKISGLDAGQDADAEALRPAVEHAIEHFGPERLMLGSDWPVAVLRGGYAKVWSAMNATLDGLSEAQRNRIRGGTAAAFYRIAVASGGQSRRSD